MTGNWDEYIIFAHAGALRDRVTESANAGNEVTRAKKSHRNLNLMLVNHRRCNRKFRDGLKHFTKLTGKKNISKGKLNISCLFKF